RGRGRLRTVEALTEPCVGAFGVSDPREVLANLVGAEDAPAEPVGETGGEGRLPRPREPADEYERDLPPLEVVPRNGQQKRSLTGRDVVTLRGPEARHHRPDVGAKDDVMLGERGWIGFGGELAVPRHELGTEVGGADSLEVHGEKAHVGEHVAVAELVVELDAVEDARTVIKAEDLVGEQVAVAVDHFGIGDPMVEEGSP